MTTDEFYTVKIDDILYHVKTNKLAKIDSQIYAGRERKEDDYISGKMQDGSWEMIHVEKCDEWNFITDNSPIEVRFEILSMRFFELESFVHGRLI